MAAELYCTARWRRLRARKLAASPLCEYCPPGVVTAATVVDHKKPICDGGGAFDWDNLASSCVSCHSKKTVRGVEAGSFRTKAPMHDRPARGCDADGSPLDPSHPWA